MVYALVSGASRATGVSSSLIQRTNRIIYLFLVVIKPGSGYIKFALRIMRP